MVTAPVKYHAQKPLQKSTVLPVENLAAQFIKWGSNDWFPESS